MDQYSFFTRLNLRPTAILLTGLQVKHWGKTLILDVRYLPLDGPDQYYRLTFQNCFRMQWEMERDDEDDFSHEPVLDILDLDIGEDNYQRRMMLHTTEYIEIFGDYERLVIEPLTPTSTPEI